MHSAILSTGMDSRASVESSFSGYLRSGPTTLSPSTNPTAMCSITKIPAVLRIVSLPVLSLPIDYSFDACGPARDSHLHRLGLGQFVQAVERCRLVAFRERRIIKYGVNEILDGSFERKNRLPDVE